MITRHRQRQPDRQTDAPSDHSDATTLDSCFLDRFNTLVGLDSAVEPVETTVSLENSVTANSSIVPSSSFSYSTMADFSAGRSLCFSGASYDNGSLFIQKFVDYMEMRDVPTDKYCLHVRWSDLLVTRNRQTGPRLKIHSRPGMAPPSLTIGFPVGGSLQERRRPSRASTRTRIRSRTCV